MPWSEVISTGDVVAIHAVLVPTVDGSGEILLFGGDNHFRRANLEHDTDHTARFNCRNPTQLLVKVVSPQNVDLFCCGHAFLGNERLLVAGGTESFPEDTPPPHGTATHFGGLREASVYNAATMAFNKVAPMAFEPGRTVGGGRWYPTLCTLATGEILAVGGHPLGEDNRHNNNRPERYHPLIDRWILLDKTTGPEAPEDDLYPRLHVLRDGSVFVSSKMEGNSKCIASNSWTGNKRDVCDLPKDTLGMPDENTYFGFDCPSVLLPLTPRDGYQPRVLRCGGVTSRMADLGVDRPTWKEIPRAGSTEKSRRKNASATILPTGDVLMTGGNGNDESGVMEPELYSTPVDHAAGTPSYVRGTGKWQTINEPATVVRNYHSTALLMPDGRVWTGGGNRVERDFSLNPPDEQPTGPPGPDQKKIEIFDPPYPAGNRPSIAECPKVIAYTQVFAVESPQAQDIRWVTLLRCGSSTHAFDSDQRCIFLSFTPETENRLRVTAPPEGEVAPPGHYMLFLVDTAGRPCQYAKFVRVGGTMSLVGVLRNKVSLGDMSKEGPALASHSGRLFLAWRGVNDLQLNIMFSEDNGATFRGKKMLGEFSDHNPALASHGGFLSLAWTGTDNHLNVRKVKLSTDAAGALAIEGLEFREIRESLGDMSKEGPALASHSERLFLAWRGVNDLQLNIMLSKDNGATFSGIKTYGEFSDHNPALASHGGFLILAWTGTDNHLNVAPATTLPLGIGTRIAAVPRLEIHGNTPF